MTSQNPYQSPVGSGYPPVPPPPPVDRAGAQEPVGQVVEEEALTFEEEAACPPDEPTFDPDASRVEEAVEESGDGPRVIQTDIEGVDGLSKCAQCGSTEISLNPATGKLRCHFCRYEWDAKPALASMGLDAPVHQLTGFVMGSGAGDIVPSTDVVVTFKCGACGAEVVIDTAHSTQARCHWCRNVLSMNQQIPNGAVPDMVLPFRITKEQAVAKISEFVSKRKFFANRKFLREFDPSNVMGVYLPYMVVDMNAKVFLAGQGEHQTRKYTVKVGDSEQTRYDADLYDLWRSFNLQIDDLTIESAAERLDQDTKKNTNNIINSVMPFDTENAVVYDSNYLSGFTSERRDTNIDQIAPLVGLQVGDVARHCAKDLTKFFDRGVRWDQETLEVVGQRWVSAYLPVWLYSYRQEKGAGEGLLHYVAVNARTGETMGSVPVSQGRLISVSVLVEILGIAAFVVALLAGM